eukprot:TRINITY_DN16589_c0_g1_i1.p1 TRINITY_DN16589_c0_g1~~TRINITY_DN16589_c0_g1_i1.p1  ORF type:complete len:226 (-),score=59.19 TRINITY_DN16589_c0_g1_i1:91-768(-)
MSAFPKLRLVYFPVRARAECARMILAYGGIPYKDEDCNSFFGMSFGEAKQSGKLPFGQLPLLQIGGEGGRLIAQSGSINRYLAGLVKTHGFFPADPAELAFCDMVHETAQDIAKINPIVNMFKGEKFELEKEDYFTNILPAKLKALASLLSTNQFFCGDTVTYADFAVYHQLDLCRLAQPTVYAEFSNIQQWMARVEKLDGVSGYLATRPEVVGIGVNPTMQPRA